MAEITSLVSALNAAKTVAETLRFIQQSTSSLEKAEYQSKLAEVMNVVTDLRGELINVKEEIHNRDSQISELQEKLKLRGQRIFDDFCYWLVDGNTKDGPYCQRCQDSESKFIRLQVVSDQGSWECMSCKNIFTSKGYRNRPRQTVSNTRGEW